MMRWLLGVIGALVLTVVVIAAAAAGYVEWKARTAAREGAARLGRELALPTPSGGASNAPVLILLHGAGLNGQMWNAVRRQLDPAYRVIALDLPGHGVDRAGGFSLDGVTAAIVAAARSVAPAPVVLVGDSLGGYSAMAAASSVPRDQLKGLVLAGSSGTIDVRGVAGGIAQFVFVRALLIVADENDLAARALGHFGVAAADVPAIVAAGVNLSAVAPAARSLVGIDFRAKLAALDVPVLIINGTLDTAAIAHEPSFVAAARHATSLHFENCEHGVSMRRPAEFAAAVNAFTARAASATPRNPS